MNKISPQLWLTDIRKVMTEDVSHFDAVITVCEENISDLVTCDYLHFNLQTATSCSGPTGTGRDFSTFTEAVDTAVEHLQNGDTILIHCHSGTSRSVAVSATALARHSSVGFEAALATIQEKRQDANPSDFYRRYGEQYLSEEVPIP